MKTKNFLLTAAIIICGMMCVSSANAQAKTNSVVVNIKLSKVVSIKVLPSASTVDLEYKSQANYLDGVSVTKKEHLEVFSTGAFEVSVDEASPFKSSEGNEIDAANTVKITPAFSSGVISGVSLNKDVPLVSEAKIIDSTVGIKATKFNITYAGAANDAYINNPHGTYTTNVTYSIVAK